jgi:hypothetical protein
MPSPIALLRAKTDRYFALKNALMRLVSILLAEKTFRKKGYADGAAANLQ